MTSFAVNGKTEELIIGWRSLLMKQYNWRTGKCIRSWKV